MDTQQMQRFQLVNPTTSLDSPIQPGEAVAMVGAQDEMATDVLASTLAMSHNYMAANGPARPTQKVRTKVMTHAQLEEQIMNEKAGLPSNLEEASRVVALESQVGDIASMLKQLIQGQQGGQPLTPPASPAAVQPPALEHPLQQTPPAPQPSETPVNPTVEATPLSVEPQPLPTQTPETGKVPLSLGPTGSPEPVETEHTPAFIPFQNLVPGSPPTPTVRPGPPIPDPSPAPENQEPQVGPTDELDVIEATVDQVELKLSQRETALIEGVTTWLHSKDVHKFWRTFTATACNKNLAFNTWPHILQEPFNTRFTQMLGDPTFVQSICKRILQFDNGHMVGANVAASFVVTCAGFLSFALLEN